jgi:enterochelin esterase family protein
VRRAFYLLALAVLLTSQKAYGQQKAKDVNTAPEGIPSLAVGKPVEREIRAGEVHLYRINLQSGEFVRGTVEQRGITVSVRGFFPDGSKIRSFGGPPTGTRNFRFVAEAPGDYRLELKTAGATASGRYLIRLEQIQPMSERLKTVSDEKYHSPRLVALRKDIATQGGVALDKFWQEIRQTGTPLVEALEGSDRYMLVTFLWRATFETHNVLIVWTPYSTEQPDDYKMTHMSDTDLWYKTLRVQKGARFLYQLSPNDTLSRSPNSQRYATAQFDPLNSKRRPDDPNVTRYEVVSIAELPGAPPQPWAVARPGIAAGKVDEHRIKSVFLNNERDIAIYTPASYQRGNHPYDLLVLLDETTYKTQVPAPAILDNLIAEKKIAPLVAVLVNYPDMEARNRELGCNLQFAEFLCKELLPWIGENYHVTHDPARVTVGGLSLGGLAAAYVAMRNPEMFGNVLAQSGSFWWAPKRDDGEEPNWLARQYVESRRLPLRFFLEAGTFENDIIGSGGQILETSRHLRDVLLAKGYEVHYQEFVGGHDYLSWRGSLADGLIALMGTR